MEVMGWRDGGCGVEGLWPEREEVWSMTVDGELVSGRKRVGGLSVEDWSMAVGWRVGGWEEEGWRLEGRGMEHGCGMGSRWLGGGGSVAGG
jgi:hypothetical protein